MRVLRDILRSIEIAVVVVLGYAYFTHKHAKAIVPAPVSREFAPRISPATLETAKRFTVLISDEGFGSTSRGTGVVVDSMTILTCDHMVQGPEMWIYTYPVHKVLMGTPVYEDAIHDLALVRLSEPVELDQYAVFTSTNHVGQPVILIGNILGGMKWFVSYGMISERIAFYLMTDALSRGGNSGCPWLNTNGEIVALTDWGLEDKNEQPVGIGGGIDGATIIQFLDKAKHPTRGDARNVDGKLG